MKTMKKLIYFIIAGVSVVALASFTIKQYYVSKSYTKVQPRQGEIIEAVYSLGKVKTNQRYEVILGIVSTVLKLHVHEGDVVKKGQRLMELDSNMQFRAPFAGTVSMLTVNEGETVRPQVVLMRIENLHDLFIELSLEQEGAMRIKKGQAAKISFESQRGEILPGAVQAIFSKDNEFLANIKVEHLKENILPGMSADVSIEVGKVQGTLVPLKAVRNGMLTIERSGRRQKIKVDVGLIDGLSAEVRNTDLKMSDDILVPKD